jgi:3-deoxy-7-phosphoheptulonate synthase
LPKHIEAVNASRHAKTVIFACDPMHGNTITTDQGIKTRHYSHIISELTQSLEVHAKMGSKLQGVHFELTGEVGVTECVGGSMELEESELSRKYESFCDPRLNYGYILLNVANSRAKHGCSLRHSGKIKGGKRTGVQWHVIETKS